MSSVSLVGLVNSDAPWVGDLDKKLFKEIWSFESWQKVCAQGHRWKGDVCFMGFKVLALPQKRDAIEGMWGVLEQKKKRLPQEKENGLALKNLTYVSSFAFDINQLDSNQGIPIGFFIAQGIFDQLHLQKLGIYPHYQGQGAGLQLLLEGLKLATKASFKSVFLEVRQSHQKAIALYEKVGFQKIGIQKKAYEDGEDAFAMIYEASLLNSSE